MIFVIHWTRWMTRTTAVATIIWTLAPNVTQQALGAGVMLLTMLASICHHEQAPNMSIITCHQKAAMNTSTMNTSIWTCRQQLTHSVTLTTSYRAMDPLHTVPKSRQVSKSNPIYFPLSPPDVPNIFTTNSPQSILNFFSNFQVFLSSLTEIIRDYIIFFFIKKIQHKLFEKKYFFICTKMQKNIPIFTKKKKFVKNFRDLKKAPQKYDFWKKILVSFFCRIF